MLADFLQLKEVNTEFVREYLVGALYHRCYLGVVVLTLEHIEIDYIDRNCLLQIAVFLAAFQLRGVQLCPVEQRSIAIIRLHLYLNFNVNELVVHI